MPGTQRFPEKRSNDPMEFSGSVESLLHAILHGGKMIQYSQITITGAAKTFANAVALGVGAAGLPPGARAALCVLEAAVAEVNAPRVARFRTDSGAPTAANGMSVGDNGSFEINGTENLSDFQIIGIIGGNSHILHIAFYGPN